MIDSRLGPWRSAEGVAAAIGGFGPGPHPFAVPVVRSCPPVYFYEKAGFRSSGSWPVPVPRVVPAEKPL